MHLSCLLDTYTEVIPVTAPPSYRGQMVKYSYKVTIGTQRINEPTKLLKVPLRVIKLNIKEEQEEEEEKDEERRTPMTSPFINDSRSNVVNRALHQLLASASLRNTSEYTFVLYYLFC